MIKFALNVEDDSVPENLPPLEESKGPINDERMEGID